MLEKPIVVPIGGWLPLNGCVCSSIRTGENLNATKKDRKVIAFPVAAAIVRPAMQYALAA